MVASVKLFFIQMLSNNDNVSLNRVLTLLVVADIMITWTINCISLGEVKDIPWGVVSVIAIMVTGKVAQKFAEGKGE